MFNRGQMILAALLCAVFSAHAQEPELQDPMRPHVVVRSNGSLESAEQGLALTAVLVSDRRRIAVINGRIYRVGDIVNGDEILRIEPGSIRIKRGSEQMLITIKDERVTTSANDGDQDK